MRLNAILRGKETQFDPTACVAERIVELDQAEYESFLSGTQRDWPFIAGNNNFARMDSGGTLRCLLVLGEGHDDGVLVDSQGASYAYRAAFIPGARQLLAMDQLRAEQIFTEQISRIEGADLEAVRPWMYHARARAEADAGTFGAATHLGYLSKLREFGDAFERTGRLYPEATAEIFNRKEFCQPDQLLPAADYIASGDMEKGLTFLRSGIFSSMKYATDNIIENALNENLVHNSCEEIQATYGLKPEQMPQLFECLGACAEVEEVLVHDNRAAFTLCLRPQRMEQDAPAPLDQEGLAAMFARHLLWELGQPDGTQADFSGRVLSGLDFEGMSFRGAAFAGADIRQCRMSGGSFEGSDFSGAFLRGVSAYETEFTGTNFNGAVLDYCTFANTDFEGSGFTGALVRSCDFEDSQTEGADFSLARLMDCEGLEDIVRQNQTMRMEDGMA
ncbi:MAG: pentapeptide repeat-containing protein [Oscillospiraceae bacterium]|nr:pentapeptide repeat-containing protein [Oscillospiraceae bacterium]